MESYQLNPPHGGRLTELAPMNGEAASWAERAPTLPSVTLNPRQMCDLEMILNGGFSPLAGFLNEDDYDAVVENMRLANGLLWPIPITLAVSEEISAGLCAGSPVVLRDVTGVPLAVLVVGDVWRPDRALEAERVFGTTSAEHPGVAALLEEPPFNVGGTLHGLRLPLHDDFRSLRMTPAELRRAFAERGWSRVVAFQTRNPMHRAHKELTDRAAQTVDGGILIHPVVGMTKPGDVDYLTRVRCYEHILKRYPQGRAMLSLLPLAMRMAGPREAVWHAIIRKNYGCTHLVVGRDHAGPGSDSTGRPFYGPYDAQELLEELSEEIGIGVVPFVEMVYVSERDAYLPIDEVKAAGLSFSNISGTELRKRLDTDEPIPDWFSYPEVVSELRSSCPPRHKQGFTVFFTGLSGSGKSTIANGLMNRLMEQTGRPVTLLDGDVVRTHLSLGLDFSREGRSTNIRRIGFVASEITKHRGIAICAPIAPYEDDRAVNRSLISRHGGYFEVFVDTPLEVCEMRDVKGLYAKARAGIIREFTGIDDPYEAPVSPDVVCRTHVEDVEQSVDIILEALAAAGFLSTNTIRTETVELYSVPPLPSEAAFATNAG